MAAAGADSGSAADGADCAKGVEGGGGEEAQQPSSQSLAKALKDDVMADVEAVLKRKEDLLWSRGRVELQSLREGRAQVVSTLGDIQTRQDQLMNEHSQMRGTLMDITMRLEHLASEMRDSLRVAPQQAGAAPDGVDMYGGFDHGGYDVVDANAAMAQYIAAEAAFLDGPRTPTRPTMGGSSASAGPAMLAPPLPGSPAVRLSLASALDASSTTPPSQQSAKRLAIAECLDLDGPSGSTRKAGVEPWQPTDSPPRLQAGSATWQLELSPALEQAAASASTGSASTGGQLRSLRAEAPAFVPGAGFVATDHSMSGASTVDSSAAAVASPVGLRLQPPPVHAGNQESLGDPSSP